VNALSGEEFAAMPECANPADPPLETHVCVALKPRYILPGVAGHHLNPHWNRCRPFTTFVVCFATTLTPLLAQDVAWSPFSTKPFQFAVTFCGEPSEDPPVTETKGAITGTTRLFKARGENYFCMVGISDYNIKPNVGKGIAAESDELH